jgi:hypothetical protein
MLVHQATICTYKCNMTTLSMIKHIFLTEIEIIFFLATYISVNAVTVRDIMLMKMND